MFYDESMPPITAKTRLVERRIKFTEKQDNALLGLSERTNVPYSALVRMAVDSFIPRTTNCCYTEKGIRSGYLNKNY